MTLLLDREPWMARAACRNADHDLFFGNTGSTVAQAKAICAECPVRLHCLDYANRELQGESNHGIWGGTTPAERTAMRSGRRPMPPPPPAPWVKECLECGGRFSPDDPRQRICSGFCRRIRQRRQKEAWKVKEGLG